MSCANERERMRVCVRTCSPFDSSALTRNVNLVKSCPCDTPLVNSGGTAILFQSYLEQDLRNQVQVQTGESTLDAQLPQNQSSK